VLDEVMADHTADAVLGGRSYDRCPPDSSSRQHKPRISGGCVRPHHGRVFSYAETGTPEIVAAAGVTRGARYHHFADRQALFAAVVERGAATVAEEIGRASPSSLLAP
jgi:hypothetical protein